MSSTSVLILLSFIVLSLLPLLVGFFIRHIVAKVYTLAVAFLSFIVSLLTINFIRTIRSMGPSSQSEGTTSVEIFVENIYTKNEWTISYIGLFIFILLILINVWYFRKPIKRKLA